VRQSAFGLLDSHTGGTGWEAVAHGPADAVTIPDAHLLFSGDFKRAGTDLILSDETHRFVVHDYFRGEHHPTLLSPDGATLAAEVVEALTGHGPYAQAGATPNAVVAVGRVAKVEGSAAIVRNGVAITVNTGDAVLKGDVLQTGAGVLGVTFVDGSTLSLTGNSRLMVDDFVYDSNGSANSEVLNLVQGSLSFISGEVAHTGGNMKITTPVATMGIRGTVGGVTQASDGTVSFFVVESATGAVVTDNAGHVLFQVVQNGPLIQVRPAGPLQVIAEEVQKSPQELAIELAVLQQIVGTQAVGQQIIQHFQDLQNNQGPHSTGTDHTQIQIDMPKSALSDFGTSGATTGSGGNNQNSGNTATVTSTDSSGNTTKTEVLLEQQQDPTPPPSGEKIVYWTGNGGNSDPSDPTNWTPGPPTPTDDPVIGRSPNNDSVPDVRVVAPTFAAHSLTLSDGAQLQTGDVSIAGDIAIFGDGDRPTGIFGDLAINLGGNFFMQATGGDAEITACGDLSIGPVAGAFTVEAVVPAGQCASADAEIRAAGHDLTIGAIGGSFLLSATVEDGGSGSATAEISAANVTIGNVGHDFTITGDACSSAFAEISATCGDVSIGNIVGDFLNQGLIDADNGVLSIGTVGGTFVNDGVMRAYELQIANGNTALDNQGKIIESGGSGGGDDVGTIGVDLHNSGLFKVTDGAGLEFNSSVHNYDCGTIVASDCGGIAFNDPVFNSGLIKASHDGEIDFNAGVHNFATIEAASCGSIHFGDVSVDNCGTIEANSGGIIDFSHWVGGNGTLAMDGGTVELASGTCNTIDFSGACGGNLVLDCAIAGVGQITNFGPDDSIDLATLNDVSIVGYTADSCNTGVLELHSSAAGDFHLSFTGDSTNYTIDNFVLSCNQSCGTLITEAPAIDVLNQTVNTDSETNVTTVTDFKIVEPFAGNEPLTITAVADHDATLAFGDGPASGTISQTATLDEINTVLHNGVVYTPGSCTPDIDNVGVTIADNHGNSENLNLMFKVAQTPGGVTLTAMSGNDVMYGTESCDIFVFDNSHSGHDVVANFDASHDTLEFNDSVFASIQAVLASAHDDIHGDAVITTAQNNTVTLDHVSAAALNSSNIAIHSSGFG
jgi:hypothetical protein